MTQIIADSKHNQDIVTLSSVGFTDEMIIACVYQNTISLLRPSSSDGSYEFFGVSKNRPGIHSRSKTIRECVEKNLFCDDSRVYTFNSWGEFAKSAVENGWT